MIDLWKNFPDVGIVFLKTIIKTDLLLRIDMTGKGHGIFLKRWQQGRKLLQPFIVIPVLAHDTKTLIIEQILLCKFH